MEGNTKSPGPAWPLIGCGARGKSVTVFKPSFLGVCRVDDGQLLESRDLVRNEGPECAVNVESQWIRSGYAHHPPLDMHTGPCSSPSSNTQASYCPPHVFEFGRVALFYRE